MQPSSLHFQWDMENLLIIKSSKTKELSQIEEWQGGDIIVFKDHIGIISDKRNKKGIPFLIHHANPIQVNYEEDVLELYGQDYIIGHYRIS